MKVEHDEDEHAEDDEVGLECESLEFAFVVLLLFVGIVCFSHFVGS